MAPDMLPIITMLPGAFRSIRWRATEVAKSDQVVDFSMLLNDLSDTSLDRLRVRHISVVGCDLWGSGGHMFSLAQLELVE
ncbi:hypothetical protein LB503_006865 [Fusarium chuoi]|nr:hypothetical protein LB503_006865 [Fusarium chuoi]